MVCPGMVLRARPKRPLSFVGLIALVTSPHQSSNAFFPSFSLSPSRQVSFAFQPQQRSSRIQAATSSSASLLFSSPSSRPSDCGCNMNDATNIAISGSPSNEARDVNIAEALSKSTVYRIDDGSAVSVSNFIASEGVSLVVLTRSFG